MAQNKVVKDDTNVVVMVFDKDISGASEIVLEIGGENYSTSSNPSNLYVDGTYNLVLAIGSATSLANGYYYPDVTADGENLIGECNESLNDFITVC